MPSIVSAADLIVRFIGRFQAGIEKEFALGKWLRERYDGWLPEAYSADDVYVRSSDYDRTIVSADANLAGMYPPAGPEKRPQLIPVHTVPKPQDNVSTHFCNGGTMMFNYFYFFSE